MTTAQNDGPRDFRSGFGAYDFALSAEAEQRARRLHNQAIVIDLMFQGPIGYRSLQGDLLQTERARWEASHDPSTFVSCLHRISELAGSGALSDYAAIWRESGLTATNLQVLGNPREGGHLPRLKEIAAHSDWYGLALTPQDIRQAKGLGRCVSFLNYQYFPPFMDGIDWIEDSYIAGVRMAGLTYNLPNQFGAGCTSVDEGVTPLGRGAIHKMNELGMLIDTGHAGTRTTIDACSISRQPVICSHAPAHALFDHPRGKVDDALRALRDTGGVCGVVAAPALLTKDGPGDIALTLNNIDYLAETFGVDFVALGTDWPLQLPKWVLAPDGPMRTWLRDMGFSDEQVERPDFNLKGFDDYRDFPNITRGLVARGYSDDDILKILGGNALRVIEAVWR